MFIGLCCPIGLRSTAMGRQKFKASFNIRSRLHNFVSITCFGSGRFDVDRERWGAGVETQKNVREEIGGWGRVPFNGTYAPSLSTIYDGA